EAAANKLIKDVGLNEAFRRCACLPIETPSAVVEGFVNLPSDGKEELLKSLADDGATPLARIHQLRLLLSTGGKFKARAAELTTKLLTTDERKEAAAMIEAVTWSWHELGSLPRGQALGSTERLLCAWTHGTKLFGSLRATSTPDQIEGFLREHRDVAP